MGAGPEDDLAFVSTGGGGGGVLGMFSVPEAEGEGFVDESVGGCGTPAGAFWLLEPGTIVSSTFLPSAKFLCGAISSVSRYAVAIENPVPEQGVKGQAAVPQAIGLENGTSQLQTQASLLAVEEHAASCAE